MSEQYLILFSEQCPLEERFGDPEENLHAALLVGPPNAQDVANEVCVALNLDVDFKRNAAPHFAARPAASPPDPLWAQFVVEIEDCENRSGSADGDAHSRAAAYHHKAKKLEAAMRKRMGLPGSTATTQRKPKQSGRGRKPDTDIKEDAKIAAAWETRRYGKHEELARAMRKTTEEVKLALDRHRKRPT